MKILLKILKVSQQEIINNINTSKKLKLYVVI